MIQRATLLILLAFLWGCDDTSSTAGTSSETTTGVQVFLPNGSPAASARVQVYAVGDTGSLPLSQSFTNSRGELQVTVPKAGRYNLVIRGDSLSLLEDSLVSDGTSMSAWSDTLRVPGRVVGRVRVQSFDDPRIAWVYLTGSGLYSNVDDSGRFSFARVAPGRYAIAFFTTKDSVYTPTFRTGQVIPDSTLDLGTVDLVYTGLPLVTGLTADYDASQGVLNVRWNRSTSRKVAAWAVHVGDPSSSSLTDSAFRTSDTSWSQRIFSSAGFDTSGFDTTTKHRTIRVAVIDSNGVQGIAWTTLKLDLPSPFLYEKTTVSWNRAGSLPTSLGAPFGMDTLGGQLLLFGRADTAFSLLNPGTFGIWSSADGMQWNQLDSALPVVPENRAMETWKPSAPVVWNGRLYRLSLHIRDTVSVEFPAGNYLLRYDTAILLSRSLTEGWTEVKRISLNANTNEAILSPFANGIRILQFSISESDALYESMVGAIRFDGTAWHDEPDFAKASIQSGTQTLIRYVQGASGSWSRKLSNWYYEPFPWVGKGIRNARGDAPLLPLACFQSALLDDGTRAYLVGKGCSAAMALSGTDTSWHAMTAPPGNGLGTDRDAGLLGMTYSAFWNGHFATLTDSGLYVGTSAVH